MSLAPHISVIIPTYNRAGFLAECLASVAAQTAADFELIVIDDGSTDETESLCQQASIDYHYIYQENSGVSAARNLGIQSSHAEWLAFLDSDDLWEPTKLARQLEFIQNYPETRILQSEEIWIRNGKRVNPRDIHAKPSGWVFEEMIPLCRVSPSAVMIHRDVFERVGLFDEALPACEDYDLWLRIALHYPIECLREPLVIKRGGHEDQLSKQWGLDRYRIQALEKILQEPKLTDKQRELVIADIRRRCEILIQGFEKRGKVEPSIQYRQMIQAYEGVI